MTTELPWTREPRTGIDRAHTSHGDYTIGFSGYDFILTFHPTGQRTGGQQLGRGTQELARNLAAADYQHRLNQVHQHTSEDMNNRVDRLIEAIHNAIDYTDGSNARTEIRQGLIAGLIAANLRLAPRGNNHDRP